MLGINDMQFLPSLVSTALPKAIFFDLDGTLINSAPDLAASINSMLDGYNLPNVTLKQVSAWIGNGAPKLVERALTYLENTTSVALPAHSQALQAFFNAYIQEQGKHSVVYDGVIDTLTQLQKQGVDMAVITNKPKQFTPSVLKEHGLDVFFSLVLSGDSLSEHKPHPLPLQHALQFFNVTSGEVVMVGDSSSDILAAQAAGVASVCVTYGYNHGNNPYDLPANAHIDCFSALIK